MNLREMLVAMHLRFIFWRQLNDPKLLRHAQKEFGLGPKATWEEVLTLMKHKLNTLNRYCKD